MHRLFVAIRPPPSVRDLLVDAMEAVPAARWQDDDQLHLTLRFIGEVEARVADDVVLALQTVRQPPVEVEIAGVGTFEKRGKVHTLWAGVRPREPLAVLHRKLDQALVRLGLPPEGRAYAPHITLARFARGGGAELRSFLDRHSGLTAPAFRCDWFALYESKIGHHGAIYAEVERYPLRA